MDPNWITITSLLIATIAAYVAIDNNFLLYGILVLITGMMDALDGAVARLKKQETNFGNYLDAVCDRISEVILLIPFSTIHPTLAFSAVSGSLLFSYSKARVAMIIKTNNNEWPQFFERAERMMFLGFGSIVISFIPDMTVNFLLLFNILIWINLIQRILFAKDKLQ